MDEPTNHLDIKSKNVLKAALKNMKEPCLVSHDRIFFKVCLISFRDQKIKEYLGDVNYFLEQRNLENMREVEKRMRSSSLKDSNKASYEEQKGKHCRIV
jgi:ATP-binding cassette subfamily F protein 3